MIIKDKKFSKECPFPINKNWNLVKVAMPYPNLALFYKVNHGRFSSRLDDDLILEESRLAEGGSWYVWREIA